MMPIVHSVLCLVDGNVTCMRMAVCLIIALYPVAYPQQSNRQ